MLEMISRTTRLLAVLWFVLALVHSGRCAGTQPIKIERAAQIGRGTVLFVPQGYNPLKTPSLALAASPRESGRMPRDWTLVPEFNSQNGKAGASLAVPRGSSLYGTGEVSGPLLRNGKTIEIWNTDNFAYKKDGGRRLYQSHPWVLGVRPDGTAFGVLFDTTWKAELQTNSDRIVFNGEGAPFRVAVIDRESPQAVMRGLAELIGTMPLPPRWALGFHQCRYSYYPDAQVREIASEFRKRHLPCDVIWLDIHYMNGYRIFTFDPKRFPNPKATNDYLHRNGFHSVWMIDPGVKAERGYFVYDSGSARHLWVQKADGKDYQGEVWPGMCVFPDFTMPDTRHWWGGLYKDVIAKGIDGVWNDMNEPAVFNAPDWTMPENNVHRGGGNLPAGPHRMYHNVYGMLETAATRQGILKARPDKRPFVLTRSTHLGGQRYAATWTGDNMARMEYLKTSVPMSLNLGLSGQPLSGADIGGYEGNATPDLFGKWIATGVFYPFCRAHASVESQFQEPWRFGAEIENVARTALERRYRLLPYLYTLAFNASKTGEPIMQPVFFADPKDPQLRAEESAFLFGPDLLVIPPWASDPKLPKGVWRDVSLLDGNREKDGYQPEVKIRGGAIVPLGRVVQNTNEASLSPLTLLVCLSQSGQARGNLYEDAGDGFGYTRGDFALTTYRARREGESVVVGVESRQGRMRIPDRPVEVRLITENGVLEGRGTESKGIVVAGLPASMARPSPTASP
jgi:alpha-glucosidase